MTGVDQVAQRMWRLIFRKWYWLQVTQGIAGRGQRRRAAQGHHSPRFHDGVQPAVLPLTHCRRDLCNKDGCAAIIRDDL